MKNKVLFVDDDLRIRNLTGKFLTNQGFDVVCIENASNARNILKELNFDIAIIDVMMPGEDGFSLTKYIESSYRIPIILLTAKVDIDSKISGFSSGADDYLTKPFEPLELCLRIKSLLKRASDIQLAKQAMSHEVNQAISHEVNQVISHEVNQVTNYAVNQAINYIINQKINQITYSFGCVTYSPEIGEMFNNNSKQRVILSSSEISLLNMFIENANKPISRDSLSCCLGYKVDNRSVDVQITRLRKKIELDYKSPQVLKTVRHIGYVFVLI